MLDNNDSLNYICSQGVDEEDRVSVSTDVMGMNHIHFEYISILIHIVSLQLDQKSESDPLDSKQKQWILCAARGDYHALAKMCKENAKLVKTKVSLNTCIQKNIHSYKYIQYVRFNNLRKLIDCKQNTINQDKLKYTI